MNFFDPIEPGLTETRKNGRIQFCWAANDAADDTANGKIAVEPTPAGLHLYVSELYVGGFDMLNSTQDGSHTPQLLLFDSGCEEPVIKVAFLDDGRTLITLNPRLRQTTDVPSSLQTIHDSQAWLEAPAEEEEDA
jgi:hypothetical protein